MRTVLARWKIAIGVGLLTLSLLAGSGASDPADSDGDQVPDDVDNCVWDANGPLDPSNQVDTDNDGFGNVCDCDFDQDYRIVASDLALIAAAFNSDLELYDVTGDGFVLGDDITHCYQWIVLYQPG
jgi:hypothetical protein